MPASAIGAQIEQPISLSLTHESMYVISFGTGTSRERVSYRRSADWLQVHANESRLSCATDTSHTTAFEISSNIPRISPQSIVVDPNTKCNVNNLDMREAVII